MKKYIKNIVLASLIIGGLFSCHDDLDQTPIDPDIVSELDVFANATEAKQALAKLYASLALTGQKGPDGSPDISEIDEGTSQFTRMLYNLNELTTDHCVVGWGDPGVPDMHNQTWGAANPFIEAMYYRLGQEVSFCNSFIANAESLASDSNVATFIAEARFLRAYAYYNLMDLYGSVPLTTKVETTLPTQATRTEIFNFVESELLEIADLLPTSGGNEYGRVDKTAAQALLARAYLNAEVYTGTARYADALTYAENTINGAYSISTNSNDNYNAYQYLFLADNNSNGAQNEAIFTLNFDGTSSQTWGGATFMVHAPTGGTMDPAALGINGGWFGYRTTKALVEKFNGIENDPDTGYPIAWDDNRALFYTDEQNYEIADIGTFNDGYGIIKYRNVDVNGNQGSDQSGNHVDCDIPVIRLAEIYLIYAEAVARGAGGAPATAVGYINELRTRANAPTITEADLTPEFVLDERSRELFWEGLRRTDLIRFGQFSDGSYVWPWKGGSADGVSTSSHRNLFPIPSSILTLNPNMVQNTGY